MIGLYGFVVRKERSDWLVRIHCPDNLIRRPGDLSLSASMDFLLYELQTVVSRKSRRRYAKCVLFCDDFAVRPAVARNTNKRPSIFIYYLLYLV